eukprot:747233-Hanusia_phi.AAC.3
MRIFCSLLLILNSISHRALSSLPAPTTLPPCCLRLRGGITMGKLVSLRNVYVPRETMELTKKAGDGGSTACLQR